MSSNRNYLADNLLMMQSVQREFKIITERHVKVVCLCCFLTEMVRTIIAELINLLECANECSITGLHGLMFEVHEAY